MNLWFMQCSNKREWTISQFVIVKRKWTSHLYASVLLYTMNFVITCQSNLRIDWAIASWIHSYFDNLPTKLMINNRTDAWKADVNLLNRPTDGALSSWKLAALIFSLKDEGSWVEYIKKNCLQSVSYLRRVKWPLLSQLIGSAHLVISGLARAKYVTPAFNSKWKYEKLIAAVILILQNTQSLIVISRCCFAEDSKEMYKDL